MPISYSGAEPQDLAAAIDALEGRTTTFTRTTEPSSVASETKAFREGDLWIWYADTGTTPLVFFVFEADRTWRRIGSP